MTIRALNPFSSGAVALEPRAGQVALAELEALRLDTDVLSPSAGSAIEPWVEAFRAAHTPGDELRLPAPGKVSEPRLSAALSRVLSAPPLQSEAGPSPIDAAFRQTLAVIDKARHELRTPARTLG